MCDSLTWRGVTYTSSTSQPSDTLVNAVGCDSVISLHLTVNHGTFDTYTHDACDSYLWHDTLYSLSGTYTFSYLNSFGCQSSDTLQLTIHSASHTNVYDTACDQFTWFDSTYTASTHDATYTIQNIYGCDSILHLHLTVNHSVLDTIVDTAQGSYTWNGNTYTRSGEYYYFGQTAEGCDSTVVLLLTIGDDIGITPLEALDLITVYPNPTSGKITVEAQGVVTVEVYDNTGRRVARFADTRHIDISQLPAGNYTLRVTLPQGSTVRRVVKR